MSTQFTNRQWRLPNNENKDKQSNYSMDFDGSSQLVDLGTGLKSTFDGATAFTISAWFKYDTANPNYSTIIQQEYTAAGDNYLATVRLSNTSTPQISNRNVTLTDTTALNSGQWYHIVSVFDGSSQTLTMYIDGTQLAQNTSAGSSMLTSASGSKCIIGANANNDRFLDGQIDGVSIFNYALSSSQVTTLYGSSSTGIGNPMSLSPAPVAYYPLGDQDAFNGSNYLVPNSSLKDYVFDFIPNDYISLNNGISLNSSGYSLSIWFNSNSFSAIQVLFTNATSNIKFVSINNSTTIRVRDGVNQREYTVPTLNTGVWYNLIIVVDNGNCQVYLNSNVSSSSAQTVNQNWSIDAINGYSNFHGGSFNFNGELSNAQIFNTALPATGSNSVETLYNNGSPLTSMTGFTSLQGWWKLDASATYDGSDWTIADSSSNSNTGTSSGMTQANLVQSDLSFTSGYSPYALDFDGTNDSIDCGNDASFNFGTGDFTVSSWINISSGDSSYRWIFGYGQTTGLEIGLNNTTNNNLRLWIAGSLLISSESISSNTWHNLVVKRESGSILAFLDNTSLTLGSGGAGSITNNNTYIGVWGSGVEDYFNGSISNVSVWNAGLTQAQVTEIYSEGVPSNLNNHSAYSNLVSWWQLGSNSSFNTNWTVLDEKGSNNGTSVNMTEADIVDGVGSYANGLGTSGLEVVGSAPFSDANSLSVNMDVEDRVTGISNATITTGGTGYVTGTNIATTGGTGSGCTVDITASGGAITAVTINNSGSGYSVGEVLTVVQSGGSSGTITVTSLNTPS